MISHSTRLRALLAHLQSQRVLVAAWVLALSSAFAVPPDRAYGGYVDYRTLCLLFSLMVAMAGLQQLGVFQRIGMRLLRTVRTSSPLSPSPVPFCAWRISSSGFRLLWSCRPLQPISAAFCSPSEIHRTCISIPDPATLFRLSYI